MSTLVADTSHTLIIPGELFSRIARIAEARGQDPDQLTLAALAATFQSAPTVGNSRLRIAQDRAQQAFEDSGLTEDEIGADIDAEIKAYRVERSAQGV